MEDLGELIAACRAADTEKITERKKNITKIQQLLGKDYIVRALNSNSEKSRDTKRHDRGQKFFTWETMFKVGKMLVMHEGEALRKAKEPKSAAANSNRERKKIEISSLFKMIVRLANKKQPWLRGGDVVQHVLDILSDDFLCSVFASDHSSMLFKHILNVRKYWTEIPSKTWHELLGHYCLLLKDPPVRCERVVLARIVHTVVQGASQQCDLRGKRLLPILEDYFLNIRSEKNVAVTELMTSTLLCLSQSLAYDGRLQVCRQGEAVLHMLLYIWTHRPTDKLKAVLVDYFQLQMSAHHPHGAHTEQQGAFAVNWELWKSNLRRLYEAIYSDYQELRSRNKFASGSREVGNVVLAENYIRLAADVFHQIFKEKTNVLEVTQLSFLATQPGGPAKKRRLESGWEVLRDAIATQGASTNVIPWLQLLTSLLEHYPVSLPEEELLELLNSLSAAAADCRHADVLTRLQRALKAVARSQCCLKLSEVTQLSANAVWEKVWAVTLRSLTLHHAEASGFALLSCLLTCDLVTPGKDMWTLFLPVICKPSAAAADFLARYLSGCDLPESYRPGLMQTMSTQAQAYPLRNQLYDWLLPNTTEEAEESPVPVYGQVPAGLLAELIVVLTLRDTQTIQRSRDDSMGCCDMDNLVALYLETSFEEGAVAKKTTVSCDKVRHTSCVPSLQKKLDEILIRDTKQLIHTVGETGSHLGWQLYQCSLLLGVYSAMLRHHVIVIDQAPLTALWEPLLELLSCLTKVLREEIKVKTIAELTPSLVSLRDVFALGLPSHTGSENKLLCSRQQSELALVLRTVTPAGVIDALLEIASGKLASQQSTTTNNNASKVKSRSQRSLSFDDFDMDVDEQAGGDNYFEEDAEPDEWGESQESDDFSVARASACVSLLSPTLLTEIQQSRLLAVSALCSWCNHDRIASHVAIGNHKPPYPTQKIRKKICGLLDSGRWDANKAFDMQMLQVVLRELSHPGQQLSDEDMEDILEAIRLVCHFHRRDQELCRTVLHWLSRLAPHLVAKTGSASQGCQESRETALRILGVFWKLCKEQQVVRETRLSVAKCMQALIELDPCGEWTFWKVPGEEDSDEIAMQFLSEEFPQLLLDGHHPVRMQVTACFPSLFGDNRGVSYEGHERSKQEEMFESVYRALQDIMISKGRLSADEQKDEAVNRVACLLSTLSSVAAISPVCEKKAVFAICQMYREKSLDTELVKKVLSQLSRRLQYSCLQQLMSSHLPFLVQQWMEIGYQIQEFPHALVGLDPQVEFYRTHQDILVPQLLMRKDVDSLTAITEVLGTSLSALLEATSPKILIHILPLFAASKAEGGVTDRSVQKRVQHANSCYELLTSHVVNEVVEGQIVTSLDAIVVDLLSTMHDKFSDGKTQHYTRHNDPEPNPPCFSTSNILATLNYLTQGHSAGVTSVVGLLAKTQDGLQRVLLALRLKLGSAHRPWEKHRVLCMYGLLGRLILKEFHQQLGGAWAFVLRDMICTLTHTLTTLQPHVSKEFSNSQECELALMCVELLGEVCRVAAENCPLELSRFLSLVVGAVVPFGQDLYDLSTKSVSLLELLVLTHGDSLKDALYLLDPLPEGAAFQRAREGLQLSKTRGQRLTLRQELKCFIDTCSLSNSVNQCRLSGLKYLSDLLSKQKKLLSKLLQDDGPDGVVLVQRVIYELVQLARSEDAAVAQQAVVCLGEIGPVDLNTTALPRRAHGNQLQAAMEAYRDNPVMQRYCHLLHLLDSYLMDVRESVVVAASDVLKNILATKTGFAFCTSYKTQVQDSLLHYLHPFRCSRKKLMSLPEQDKSTERFRNCIGVRDLWAPSQADHGRDQWMQTLAVVLIGSGGLQDEILRLLAPVCETKPKFCVVVLPYLIHDILSQGVEERRFILSEHINHFFDVHCGLSEQAASRPTTPMVNRNTDLDESVCMDPWAVKTMLQVVQYLRTQTQPSQGRGDRQTKWENNFWLDLDYLKVAQAAHNCGAHFTSLLYSEIWCDVQRSLHLTESGSGKSSSQPLIEQFSQSSQWDALRPSIDLASISVQTLMLETYRSIGDPDAIYGCGAGRLADTECRIKTYEHENAWAKAIATYDLEVSGPTTSSRQLGLLKALQNFGSSHILGMYMEGLHQQGRGGHPAIRDFQYEAAWRTATWTLDTPNRLECISGPQQALYTGLGALQQRDASMLDASLKAARTHAIGQLCGVGLESARSLYPHLGQLLCVAQLQDMGHAVLSGGTEVKSVLDKWSEQDSLMSQDYDFLETCLHLHCVLLHVVSGWAGDVGRHARQAQFYHLEEMSRVAREAGRHQISEHAIHQLHLLSEASGQQQYSWRLEEAQTFWARGEHETAKHTLKELTATLKVVTDDNQEAGRLFPQCLRIYGEWLAETHSESPNVIMENYLQKAVDHMSEGDGDCVLDAYVALGRFADTQYKQMDEYISSPTYKAKQTLAAKARQEASELRQVGEQSSRYLRTLEKQSVLDEQELTAMQEDREVFLMTALSNYLRCLQLGDRHDLRVFRVTSLWFHNSRIQDVNKTIRETMTKISPHKWLPLMYQLAARMSTSIGSDGFQTTLQKLLEHVVQAHPHHSVHVILALAHANKDMEDMTGKRKSTSRLAKASQDANSQEENRQSAAKAMIARLMQSHRAHIIEDTEKLCIAYIDLANWNVDKFKRETKPIKLDAARLINKMKNLKNVAIPTRDIPVDRSGQYKDIVHILKFQETFKLAGGLNLPKIISCVGSDGVANRQLVKGKDDLRQDAVMQQVFGMVNNLLAKEQNTRKRQLRVRRYKVIPLSQRSGLLEWCEGTIPLGDYLIGSGNNNSGAHQRYRPKDLKAVECRREMLAVHESANVKQKYQVFLKVCQRFQPVFRHFFMETFSEPAEWYEQRLAYSRSVATNSIVGYILGLGDRHVQNILVDTKTAELIHIDLGIAFEQGRILPTPETVPFRLTRDLVDGLGVTGVEGVFRRGCEATMSVMHSSQEALLTILQVLLYDPLYAWTLSPAKAFALQQRRDRNDPDTTADTSVGRDILDIEETTCSRRDSQESVNKVAERVLLRLRQKLQGVEDGVQLSVAGQVNQLIQEARNPKNLCRVFPGWQPYI